MNVDSLQASIQAFALQLEQLMQVAFRTVIEIKREFSQATSTWQSPIEFSPLQWTLFKVLALLLVFTTILIGYFWKVYGKVITDKFVRPSTLKEIEELKLSVAKLKLPKEHSPRI